MPEDIETQAETPEAATAAEDSGYGQILEGQAEAPIKPDASAKAEDETNPEPKSDDSQDQEIILELGGKSFTMKQSEAIQLLENASKFAEREKTISEKEKSLNRDYTQKSQQIAEVRKSFEGAFGRIPQNDEIQALGKVWKAYFSNPQAKQALKAIISGRFDEISKGASAQPQGEENAYVSQLEAKLQALEEKLGQFTQTYEERTEAEQIGNAQKTWQGWAAKKAEAGIKITDEIDQKMAPFVRAIKDAHPDWESNQILDKAYEHATIDDIKKSVASDVLKSADKAKNGTIPRIKPKSPAKSDSEKTYAEIIRESA